ncbi:MAG: amidohydrolase family protein [Pirellulaceae bacterium]
MPRFSSCLLLLVSATTLIAAPPDTEPTVGIRERRPSTHSLVHAELVSEVGKVVKDATIVIHDGRIVSVKSGGDPAAGSRIWDLTGKMIYPGLIDAFSTTDLGNQSSGSVHWNSYIQPQRQVSAGYAPDTALHGKLRRQGVTARLVAPSSGIIKGTSAIVATNDRPRSESVLLAEAAQHIRLTVPRSRSRGQYPNSPMGAVALARQVMYDATWYQQALDRHSNSATAPRPARDDALAALQPLLAKNQLAIFDTNNELFCLRASEFAREFGFRGVLLGSGYEYRRIQDIRATGMTIILPVDFPLPPNVSTPEDSLDVSLISLMHWDIAPENPARLAAAGMTLCFTSKGLSDPGRFLEQIRVAVARGLPADVALKGLTTVPARLFGVEDSLGRVAAGYAANLVVTDGELFSKKTKVTETWVDGERFEIVKPVVSVNGEWLARWNLNGNQTDVTISLTGDTSKPIGNLTWKVDGQDEPKKLKLTKIRVTETQWAFAFRGEELGIDGILRFSATRSIRDDQVRWFGTLDLPDGTRSSVVVSPIAAENDKKKDDAAKNSTSGEGKKTTKKDEPKKVEKASFAVNYPFGSAGRTAIPVQPETVLLTHATVWTSGPQGIIRNCSILIKDGIIAAVGRDIVTPPGAFVVNCAHKHISPGIIDCHSHMATDGGVNESGQTNTAEVRVGDFIDSDDINIYRQLAGGVTSSNILHGSSNPIGGQNQVIKLRWGCRPSEMKFAEAPQGVKFALGENVKRSNRDGSNPDDRTRYPQTRMGVEQFMRDAFTAAKIYQAKQAAWKKAPRGLPPRRDLEMDAISEILNGERWIHCHSYRQDEILALIRVLDDYKIQIGTFQHILEGYKVAKEMAEHGAMGSSFSDWWAYKFEVYDAIPHNGALMHRVGVVVSYNSDDAELARHLNQEAGKAVKYGGVAKEEALKFVTLNPARQLRIDRWVGSLEPGKQADLVVWSGPPMSNLSRCEQTWVDGRRYFDLDEDRQLRDRDARRHHTLVQKILASGLPMLKPGQEKVDPSTLWPREDEFCHIHDHHDEHDHE